jgi:hypothetical protein
MKTKLRIMTAARSHPAAAIPTVGEAAFCLAGRGPVRSDRASWGPHSGNVTGIGGSGALRLRITSSPTLMVMRADGCSQRAVARCLGLSDELRAFIAANEGQLRAKD